MSLFPLKTIGDYLWNSENYNPEISWEDGVNKLLLEQKSRNALRAFMRCSMGSNVGGDPAPDLRQIFRKGVTDWRAGKLKEAAQVFVDEANFMVENAKFLQGNDFAYPDIQKEIDPWIEKYLLGAETLQVLGNALLKCTFNTDEHRIEGNQGVINELEAAIYKYLGSRKNLFGDQIDGPINELIAELGA
jgi:hypothetical protein